MSTRSRIVVAAFAVAALLVAFILLAPKDDEADQKAQEPVATESAGPTQSAATPAPRPEPIRVKVKGGQPVGGVKTIRVDSGDTVRLVVTADAPEEVHLHGYDITRAVAAGKPAKVRFKADAEGVFEIELEHSAVPIATLRVEP